MKMVKSADPFHGIEGWGGLTASPGPGTGSITGEENSGIEGSGLCIFPTTEEGD